MSGIFGVVSQSDCAETLFHGTDYHSHLGTEYGGMAVLGQDFARQIHDLSQSQFKSKFFEDYARMKGNKGIGVVSAFDEQPIYLNSSNRSISIPGSAPFVWPPMAISRTPKSWRPNCSKEASPSAKSAAEPSTPPSSSPSSSAREPTW